MRKLINSFLILVMTLLLSESCESTECCIQPKFELEGRFTHQIPNCDNQGNPEMNCTEWLEFINSSEVDILYGGGDIVQRFTYSQEADFISLEGSLNSSFKPTYIIRNASTLERRDNGDIWLKND